MYKLTQAKIESFTRHMREDEKSASTIDRYSRDLRTLLRWAEGMNESHTEEATLDKEMLLCYKAYLYEHYAVSSVNSILSSINSFFSYAGCYELRIKSVKVQRAVYAASDRELTLGDYERLLSAAKRRGDRRLYLAMQTICSTGIRVSELRYITVDALTREEAHIRCKGKQRKVFLPTLLCKMLKKYCDDQGITDGAVFVSRNGIALDRSNVWSDMKSLCSKAGVNPDKVFPHNLRHLFARTYYSSSKDIVRLADILGHSSVNTTRIYTMETGEVHKKQIQRLGLIREDCPEVTNKT